MPGRAPGEGASRREGSGGICDRMMRIEPGSIRRKEEELAELETEALNAALRALHHVKAPFLVFPWDFHGTASYFQRALKILPGESRSQPALRAAGSAGPARQLRSCTKNGPIQGQDTFPPPPPWTS